MDGKKVIVGAYAGVPWRFPEEKPGEFTPRKPLGKQVHTLLQTNHIAVAKVKKCTSKQRQQKLTMMVSDCLNPWSVVLTDKKKIRRIFELQEVEKAVIGTVDRKDAVLLLMSAKSNEPALLWVEPDTPDTEARGPFYLLRAINHLRKQLTGRDLDVIDTQGTNTPLIYEAKLKKPLKYVKVPDKLIGYESRKNQKVVPPRRKPPPPLEPEPVAPPHHEPEPIPLPEPIYHVEEEEEYDDEPIVPKFYTPMYETAHITREKWKPPVLKQAYLTASPTVTRQAVPQASQEAHKHARHVMAHRGAPPPFRPYVAPPKPEVVDAGVQSVFKVQEGPRIDASCEELPEDGSAPVDSPNRAIWPRPSFRGVLVPDPPPARQQPSIASNPPPSATYPLTDMIAAIQARDNPRARATF